MVVGAMALMGCNGGGDNSKPNAKVTYTYNTAVSGNPNTWNPHEWETSDDSIILSFTSAGLYEFVFNEARNGYEIVPEMADGEPVDVTSTLTNEDKLRYGLDVTATEGLAWAVNLREDAKWEDGTPINADTYLYSMKAILDPDMMNYRANSYYSGSAAIGNALDYYNGGHQKYNNISSGVAPMAGDDHKYFSFFEPMAASKAYGGDTYAGFSMYDWYMDDLRKSEFQENYNNTNAPATGFTKMRSGEWGTVNNPKFIDITADPAAYALAETFVDEWCNIVLDRPMSEDMLNNFFFYHTGAYEKMDFDGEEKAVGLIKTGDYQITIMTAGQLRPFDFKYSFSSNWIVKEDLYEANKTDVGGLTKTTYGTTKENYMSYGPYVLTAYQKDKVIHLSRNENYFGYSDPTVVKPGDITGDGVVKTDDARLALRISIGLEPLFTPETWQYKAADVDGKAGVTTNDARCILRAAIGLENLK